MCEAVETERTQRIMYYETLLQEWTEIFTDPNLFKVVDFVSFMDILLKLISIGYKEATAGHTINDTKNIICSTLSIKR